MVTVAEKRLLALFLSLAFLCSFTLFPLARNSLASASPDELKWSIVDTPSEQGYVVASPSEVNAFALGSDDETFYAINIPGEKVYKSTDGGITWADDLGRALEDEGATLPAWDIAVAPDNPDLVAVATNDRREVYVSEDGGKNWTNTHVSDAIGWDASLLIADIAISPEYDNNDIAIGTRNPDGITNGDVWVIRRVAFAAWQAQALSMDVTSIRFSPNYDDDKTILAIASDIDNTYLCTGARNTDENTTNWKVTDPPKVEIAELTGDSPGENEIIVSDLALPLNYSGTRASRRVVYAAYSSNTTVDDVYRIEDTEVYRLDVNDGSKVAIASIAYYGTYSSGKLLAGEVAAKASSASALVYFCSNPEEDDPEWEEPTKPPTGGFTSGRANAQLAWSYNGKVAYCGTSTNCVESAADWADPDNWEGQLQDESAFSRSKDYGDAWNQLGLIDTEISCLCDYAFLDDYETLCLASAGSSFDSLWRSTSDPLGEIWQRVLCFDSETDDIVLRPTPEASGKEAIFFAVLDSNNASYSLDNGETWKPVWQCPNITDLAIVSNELLYVLDGNLVNKGTSEDRQDIWEWQTDIDTGLLSGHAIAVSGEDFVFVGEDEDGGGKIAYSTDGGATFELTEALPELGNTQVIPDEDFDSNRLIYAASDDGGIYRWTIEGSTFWRELNPPHTGFHGLAQQGGALYGAYGAGIVRTLIPHLETVTESDWDSLTAGLASGFTFRPGTLEAVSDEAIDLWAIDGRGYDFPNNRGCLWVYSDTFVLQAPWPTSPAIGELIPCDPCACQASIFCFRWRELSLTEQYELWIATDEEFDYVIAKIDNITPANPSSPAWCAREGPLRLVCGKTYYWKVRGCATTEGETVHSCWSPPMTFTVKTGTSKGGMHIAPILVAPENGSRGVSRSPAFSWTGFPDTTKYEFILAEDVNLTLVVVTEEVPVSAYIYTGQLDWGKTYLWQVRAIEPAPSEPAIGTFTVMPEPPLAQLPAQLSVPSPTPQTPFWTWVIIGILALLAVLIITFCFATRR